MPCLLYGVRTAYIVVTYYTVITTAVILNVRYIRTSSAQTAKERNMGELMDWNKQLAEEYRESALKIKVRIDELSKQINEGLRQFKVRPNQSGWRDQETARLIKRRAELRKLYGDTVYTAHILETYYD